MKINELPSQKYLKTILSYEPSTGELYWKTRTQSDFDTDCVWYYKTWNSKNTNKPAGSVAEIKRKMSSYRYISIRINGVAYKASRIIWKIVTGKDPLIIDHKNQDATDNRWDNLKNTDVLGNSKNTSKRIDNISGVTGVSWRPEMNKWRARINTEGKTKTLGVFENYEEAVASIMEARVQYNYSLNHG